MATTTTVTRTCDITGTSGDSVESYTLRIPAIDAENDMVYNRISFDATPDAFRTFVNDLNKGIAKYLKNDDIKVKVVGNASDSEDLTHVREWARNAGYSVKDRGRIPADVMAAFNAATDDESDTDSE